MKSIISIIRSRYVSRLPAYSIVKGYKRLLGLTAGLVCLMVAAQLSIPNSIRAILDAAAIGASVPRSGSTLVPIVVFFLCAIGYLAAQNAAGYLQRVVSEHIKRDVRHTLYQREIENPEPIMAVEQRTGHSLALIMEDAETMTQLYGVYFTENLTSLLQLAGVVVVLTFKFGSTGLLAIAVACVFYVTSRVMCSKEKLAAQTVQATKAGLAAKIHEGLSGAREIKAFNLQDWDTRRTQLAIDSVANSEEQLARLGTIMSVTGGATYWAVAACVYAVGLTLAVQHRVSLGSIILLVAYIAMLDAPIRQATLLRHQIQRCLAAGERVDAVLRKVQSPRQRLKTSLRNVQGHIRLDNVGFYFSPGTPVLENVRVSIEPGERVALVGPSGAGKSTLAALLMGFYTPTSGRILVDGQDLSSADTRSLRQHVAIVFQDTYLFYGTVEENIQLGRLDASSAQIRTAAEAACADLFIRNLPKGYRTPVGERGMRLSGGERQRIAIARAILREPRILILDEATAALDPECEREVIKRVGDSARGCTCIVISHRASAIRNVDRVLVLDRGRVIEGTHISLQRESAVYRNFLFAGRLDGGWRSDELHAETLRELR